LRQKIQILIISVLVSIILLTSLNQANAVHNTSGTTSINDLTEGSFFLEIEASRANSLNAMIAVGLNAICEEQVKGKTVTLVDKERCVFEIESIRYIPSTGLGIFGKNIFFLFCTNSVGEFGNLGIVNNCFIPSQGSVDIGAGFSIGPGAVGEGMVGELINGAVSLLGDITLDVGFSVPLASVETKLAQGDYRIDRVGGNVLLDSGIGSIISQEHIAWAHDAFTGKIEIFGKKPDEMKLEIGTVLIDNKVRCGPQGTDACSDDPGFKKTLEYLCFSCLNVPGGLASSSGPAGLLQFEVPISEEDVADLINANEVQILDLMEKLISKTIGIEAVGAGTETTTDDLFVIGDFFGAIFDVDLTPLENLVVTEFLATMADLKNVVADIGAAADPTIAHDDLSGNIEEIQDIIDTIEDVVNDVVNISDTVTTLAAVELPICLDASIPDLTDLSCEMCTSGDSVSATCSGSLTARVTGGAKCTINLNSDPLEFKCVACPFKNIPEPGEKNVVLCLDANCDCYEVCDDGEPRTFISDKICTIFGP